MTNVLDLESKVEDSATEEFRWLTNEFGSGAERIKQKYLYSGFSEVDIREAFDSKGCPLKYGVAVFVKGKPKPSNHSAYNFKPQNYMNILSNPSCVDYAGAKLERVKWINENWGGSGKISERILRSENPTVYVIAVVYDDKTNRGKRLDFNKKDARNLIGRIKRKNRLENEEIILLENEEITAPLISKSIIEVSNIAKADDILFFYYSGHGSDYNLIDTEFLGMTHSHLGRILNQFPGVKVIAIDACHSQMEASELPDNSVQFASSSRDKSCRGGFTNLYLTPTFSKDTIFDFLERGGFNKSSFPLKVYNASAKFSAAIDNLIFPILERISPSFLTGRGFARGGSRGKITYNLGDLPQRRQGAQK